MILLTAWKNIWRNKIRSFVVIASVTVGIFAGIFAVSLMTGTIDQRVDSALNEEISHIQINRKDFSDNFDIALLLPDIGELNQKVASIEGVEAIAHRTIFSAMATTGSKSTGIMLIGINPDEENSVLRLNERIIDGTGSYFDEHTRKNSVYIGQDLAKELNIIWYEIFDSTLQNLAELDVPVSTQNKLEGFLGQRFKSEQDFTKTLEGVLDAREIKKYGQLILKEAWTLSQKPRFNATFLDANNNKYFQTFRVTGIYDIKNNMFESTHVFIRNEDIKSLAGLGEDDYHQLIVKVNDYEKADEIAENLKANLGKLEVKSWKTIAPDLAMMSDLVEKFYAFFLAIILAALAFGIVNTMLMAVLERTKEIGMLTAIGMNKRKVFSMIMLESIFLSLVGGISGMIVSKLVVLATAAKGINFSSAAEGFEAMGFSAHIYPSVNNTFFITVTILIIITGILSSIYPALKALRLDPAEALRTE